MIEAAATLVTEARSARPNGETARAAPADPPSSVDRLANDLDLLVGSLRGYFLIADDFRDAAGDEIQQETGRTAWGNGGVFSEELGDKLSALARLKEHLLTRLQDIVEQALALGRKTGS